MSTSETGAPRIGVRINGNRPPESRPTRKLRDLTPEVPLESEMPVGGNSPPRPMMLATVALAVLAIAAAAGARLSGAGHIPVAPTPVDVARDFRFSDGSDGSVVVTASVPGVGDGREIARLGTGELMFVRSTVRALARGRRLNETAQAQAPFRVTRYQNGRMTLDDPSTGAHLELASFGPTNQAAFEQLLDKAR